MSLRSYEHAAVTDETPCKVDELAARDHRFPPRLGDCLFVRQDDVLGLPGQVTYPTGEWRDVQAALDCSNGCELRLYGTHADDCPLEPNDRDRERCGQPYEIPDGLYAPCDRPRHPPGTQHSWPRRDAQPLLALPPVGTVDPAAVRASLEAMTPEQRAELIRSTDPGVSWVPGHEGRTDPTTGLFQGISLTGPVRKRDDHAERHLTLAGASDAPPGTDPAATPGDVSSVPTGALQELVAKAAGMAEWIAHEVGGSAAWEDYQEVREIAARLSVDLEEKP